MYVQTGVAALTRLCVIARDPCSTPLRSRQASADSCRFELACTQCLDGCESDLSHVTIDTETLPTCEPIPEGVRPSSTATTLQSLDIQEGYYRISTESTIVLECYQKDACVGGVNFSDYCAIGYEGPCKPISKYKWAWKPHRSRYLKKRGDVRILLVNHVGIGVYLDAASHMVVMKCNATGPLLQFMRQPTANTREVRYTCLESENWPPQNCLTVVCPSHRLCGVYGGLRARIK